LEICKGVLDGLSRFIPDEAFEATNLVVKIPATITPYTTAKAIRLKADRPLFRIEIAIGGGEYPKLSKYRASVPAVTFANWQEEFFYVLAHEYAHILQWLKVNGLGFSRFYEVEAEEFALLTFNKFKELQ
jgi:hypothetical protein